MAANPTTNNTTAHRPARKITTYDLVIGLLAIFSLIILIPLYFGNLSQGDKTVLIIVEEREFCLRQVDQAARRASLSRCKPGFLSWWL